MMRLQYFNIILAGSILLLYSCAKPGSPTGGPKDTQSPVVEETDPPAGSTNFSGQKIDIGFNEYVQLNNIQQNLIVSPPFSEKPEVKVRGKGIRIILPEEPVENTTYSFTFLDAISDITERNMKSSLVYAVSTGDEIDSLRIGGSVRDAWTGEKMADIYVLLYENTADSAFKTMEPRYLTKTNARGDFMFFYLAEGSYNIYALDDANNSYTFDQPNEEIAFLDRQISPEVKILRDSTDSITGYDYHPMDLELRLFEQESFQQYIEESNRPRPDKLEVIFRRPQDSVVKWESPDFDENDVYTEFSPDSDSLHFWLKDTSLCNTDSLRMMLTYHSGIDSLGSEVDSLIFAMDKGKKEIKFELDNNLNQNILNYWDTLSFVSNNVLQEIRPELIQVKREVNDSTKTSLDFGVIMSDSRHFQIDADFRAEQSYEIILDSAAVESVLHQVNDSTHIAFKLNEPTDFANLKISIPGTGEAWFCDLLQNDQLKRRRAGDDSGLFVFDRLPPGTYDIRLVKDANRNLKWDTGDIDQKRQPEPVWYKEESVELRANWQQEIEWLLFNEE